MLISATDYKPLMISLLHHTRLVSSLSDSSYLSQNKTSAKYFDTGYHELHDFHSSDNRTGPRQLFIPKKLWDGFSTSNLPYETTENVKT